MKTRVRRAVGAMLLGALVACGCSRDEGFFVADPPTAATEAQIVLDRSAGEDPGFDVTGLAPDEHAAIAALDADTLAGLLSVHVVGAGDDAPAVGGQVSLVDGALHFQPRYPLRSGVRYRVAFHRSRMPLSDPAAADTVEEFEIPRPEAGEPTVVAHIYPSADHLPENQLKFYLHFSAPMSRGEAYQRVHLLDADGKEVESPFLELGEELWDPDLRRFTLFCDPGRVKRGLKPREELGPVLEEGKSYTLIVDGDWTDAAGHPLGASARKSFDVLPPDDASVDTAAWKVEPPPAGTRDPLVARFPEPLERALMERMLWIVDATGNKVAGSIAIDDGETCWRFSPAAPWSAGDYQLVADTRLEDLAGNSIGRAFDVDVFGPVQKSIQTETAAIPFTIDGAAK